ncbi:MAG: hypothetical protein HYV34_01130 [Candidatus Kerfeldbacteria bacterium]|nr:hypothetical protein [Candidatus Kerfeldbacteria bacterium]
MAKIQSESKGSVIVVRHLDEFSLARTCSIISGVLSGFAAAVYFVLLLLTVFVGAGVGANGLYAFLVTLTVGVVFVILLVGLNGFLGFALGWVAALVYNSYLGHMGGIRLHIDLHDVKTISKPAKSRRKKSVQKTS